MSVPIYKGSLQGVVLDWAGTVVDHGCMAPAIVFVDVFKREGVPVTIEEARIPMGANKRDHIKAICEMDRVAGAWKDAHGAVPSDADIDRMYQAFIPLQVDCIASYSDLIPGTLEAQDEFRKRGVKIGTSTGYSKEMMDVLVGEAAKRGFKPDSVVSSTDVPAGRPHPWMCYQNALNLDVYPMESYVKIGDTLPDVYEGLNAGMWTIAVVMSGNEIGLTEEEYKSADPAELKPKRDAAYKKLQASGAHYLIDSIADVSPIMDEINGRLAKGERP